MEIIETCKMVNRYLLLFRILEMYPSVVWIWSLSILWVIQKFSYADSIREKVFHLIIPWISEFLLENKMFSWESSWNPNMQQLNTYTRIQFSCSVKFMSRKLKINIFWLNSMILWAYIIQRKNWNFSSMHILLFLFPEKYCSEKCVKDWRELLLRHWWMKNCIPTDKWELYEICTHILIDTKSLWII